MTAKKSTGLAAHMAVTGSVKAALDGGFLFAYSGTVPASADDALSGNTLMGKFSVGNDGVTGLTFDPTPDAGALKKTAAEAWSATVLATDTVSFYRFAAAEPTTASTTDKRIQGTVGTSVLNDLVVTTTTWTTGDARAINQFQIY